MKAVSYDVFACVTISLTLCASSWGWRGRWRCSNRRCTRGFNFFSHFVIRCRIWRGLILSPLSCFSRRGSGQLLVSSLHTLNKITMTSPLGIECQVPSDISLIRHYYFWTDLFFDEQIRKSDLWKEIIWCHILCVPSDISLIRHYYFWTDIAIRCVTK